MLYNVCATKSKVSFRRIVHSHVRALEVGCVHGSSMMGKEGGNELEGPDQDSIAKARHLVVLEHGIDTA